MMEQALRQHIELALSDKWGESVRIGQLRPLGGGCINHASRMQTNVGDYFLKWNPGGISDLFLREAESLRELAKAESELHIPKVYLAAAPTDRLPAYLLTEYLSPPEQSRSEMEEQLGRGIAQLHRYQHEQFGFHNDNYCGATPQDNRWQSDWVTFFAEQRIGALLRMIRDKRGLDSREEKAYEQLLQKLPQLLGHEPAPSLNHGDLWSGNYMFSAHGPALIDPASYYADREFDLGMMGMFGGFAARVWEAYQEEYPLELAWKDRHELYKLYHYLNHDYLFGGGYGQQALSIARSYI